MKVLLFLTMLVLAYCSGKNKSHPVEGCLNEAELDELCSQDVSTDDLATSPHNALINKLYDCIKCQRPEQITDQDVLDYVSLVSDAGEQESLMMDFINNCQCVNQPGKINADGFASCVDKVKGVLCD